MKTLLSILILCVSSIANAEIYLDVGVENLFNTDYHHARGYKETNMFGRLELGYTYENINFYLSHSSDLENTDKGLNFVGVKYRFTFYD
jgi:hypothetical protein